MSTFRELPKITFKNKEDSWKRNENSKYILTAANINEIKEVVNALSDEIGESVKFSDIYGELRLQVPNDLMMERNYDIEVEISTDSQFSTIAASVKYSESPELFKTFNNGKWVAIPSSGINGNLSEKLVKISIGELIKDKGLTYFGRFRYNSISPRSNGDWNGFCLGSYAEGEASAKNLQDLQLLDERNNKISSIAQSEHHICRFIGKNQNGGTVTIENLTLSTENPDVIVINGTEISVNENLWQPKTAIINASGKYNGVTYSLKTEICAYPMMLKKIETNIPALVRSTVSEISYRLTGVTYDNRRITGIEDEVEGTIFEAPWATIPQNGRIEIDRDAQEESKKDSFLILWSWHGKLIDYTKVDLESRRYDSLSGSVSLIASSVQSLSYAGVYTSSPEELFTGADYEVTIKGHKNNSWKNANEASLEDEFNSPGVDIVRQANGKWKISADSNVDLVVMLKMTLDGTVSRRLVKFTAVKPVDLAIEQPSVVKAGRTSTFNVYEVFSDGSRRPVQNPDLAIAGGNLAIVNSINGSSITFGEISKSRESICFKAMSPAGLEKLFIVVVTR